MRGRRAGGQERGRNNIANRTEIIPKAPTADFLHQDTKRAFKSLRSHIRTDLFGLVCASLHAVQ